MTEDHIDHLRRLQFPLHGLEEAEEFIQTYVETIQRLKSLLRNPKYKRYVNKLLNLYDSIKYATSLDALIRANDRADAIENKVQSRGRGLTEPNQNDHETEQSSNELAVRFETLKASLIAGNFNSLNILEMKEVLSQLFILKKIKRFDYLKLIALLDQLD
jgi:hypothetical protein